MIKTCPVSAIVITYNEEDRIVACLKSLDWADEIIVVDAFSTDATVSLCAAYTDKIFRKTWEGYAKQKNYGLSLARNDWVIFIDADERISPELALEIQNLYASCGQPDCRGFLIPGKTFYLGRWIEHGEWGNVKHLRLVNKRYACWLATKSVHEELELDGAIESLKGPIYHFTNRNVFHHLKKCNLYSTFYARDAYRQKRHYGLPVLATAPLKRFMDGYFRQSGYKDGIVGAVIASVQAVDVFLRYFKLRLMYAGIMKE